MATVKSDRLKTSLSTVRDALKMELLVGIPDSTAERQPEPGEKGIPPSNALLGYTLETGDPSRNLPARPFLVPAVEGIKAQTADTLRKGIEGALSRKPDAYEKALDRAGLAAVAAVQAKMLDGPFAPLAQATIEARARRRNPDTGKLKQDGRSKDARSFLKLQAQGTPDDVLHGADLAKPLLDTFDLYRSIKYVIRNKGDR